MNDDDHRTKLLSPGRFKLVNTPTIRKKQKKKPSKSFVDMLVDVYFFRHKYFDRPH